MKRRIITRNSFLLKMLFSIVGLICIPMICVQLYMITSTNREFQQENTAYYQRGVQTLGVSFDNQLKSLSATAYRMRTDSSLIRPLTEDVRGWDLQEIARKIETYGLDSPLTHSVGVYYQEKNMVLYDSAKHSMQNFCKKFYPQGTQGYAKLVDFLTSDSTRGYFYSGQFTDATGDYLIVKESIAQSSRDEQNAVAFFVIDNGRFEKWCSIFVPIGEHFAIFDKNNNYLMGADTFFTQESEDDSFRSFISDSAPSYIAANNSNMVIYKYQDINTGYTYMAAAARDTAEGTFNRYMNQVTSIIVITLFFMAVLLAITLYINYMPVHRIVKNHIRIRSNEAKVSELELINSHLFAQDEQISSQNNLLASFVVGDLLSGIEVEAETIETHFPADTYHYFASALSFVPMTTAQSTEFCRAFAAREDGKLVVTTVPYRVEMVYVYAAKRNIDLKELHERLRETASAVLGQESQVRMGTVVERVSDIQSSYNNALLADRLSGESDDTQLEGYPHTLVADFAIHVSNGDWNRLLTDLDELEAVNRELKPSVKRFVHLKVLNYYLTNVPKSGYTFSTRETNQLLSYTNGQHLYDMMRRSIAGIQNTKKIVGEESASELRKKLLDYVNQNFASSEMCLSSAADYLKTSIYTVSRIFKETTGSGFKEYITEKRLQHACLLLRKSDIPIADIAAACGFEKADYFTVIFRNRYGMAPSKFRKEANLQLPEESGEHSTPRKE